MKHIGINGFPLVISYIITQRNDKYMYLYSEAILLNKISTFVLIKLLKVCNVLTKDFCNFISFIWIYIYVLRATQSKDYEILNNSHTEYKLLLLLL